MTKKTYKKPLLLPMYDLDEIRRMKEADTASRPLIDERPASLVMHELLSAAVLRCLSITRPTVRESWRVLQAEIVQANQGRSVPLPLPSYHALHRRVAAAKAALTAWEDLRTPKCLAVDAAPHFASGDYQHLVEGFIADRYLRHLPPASGRTVAPCDSENFI